ncbi:DNA-binding response regulator [filamentous cyanobacterium CCP5]|nr:DNA-binding response regulator [filamentous cyanobacterium CCP5]
MTSLLQILLVEDDELFRLGLATRLQQEPMLEIAAEAEDGETALALVTQQEFDIVILDVGLPGLGGVETCRQMKQLMPQLPILVLTSHSQPTLINRLIEAQAQGYCVKGVAAESLILAIQSVAAGASWWDAQATQQIRAQFQQPLAEVPPSVPVPDNPLTQREREILALIASGKSNSEIAESLYIAAGTVRVHVHAILQKLEVRDRTQAVVIALRQGLIDTEGIPPNPAIEG